MKAENREEENDHIGAEGISLIEEWNPRSRAYQKKKYIDMESLN